MTCATLESIARWRLGDLELDAERAFEEHYFECELCTDRALALERLLEQLRSTLPPVLTTQRRRELEAQHPHMPAIHVSGGEGGVIRLGRGAEIGLWVMHAPLVGVTQVDLQASNGEGDILFALSHVPFDAERGEVVLACQVHYRALPVPARMHVRLTATGPGGQRPVGEYVLDHAYESL
jgi:hypothetical protein